MPECHRLLLLVDACEKLKKVMGVAADPVVKARVHGEDQ